MRISEVRIRNYRSLRDVQIPLEDYSVLVGANGSGKSSVLYALNWFFNGGSMEAEDMSSCVEHDGASVVESATENSADPDTGSVEVSVRFADLDATDRTVLGKYGKNETAWLRRSWSEAGGEKMIGNAMQPPGFAEVRNQPNAAAVKTAYVALRERTEGLPEATTKKAILEALDAWESNPANADRFEEIDNAEATHLFGFTGEQTLAQRFEMILVPGSADLATEVGTDGRGSTLSRLVGRAANDAAKEAVERWKDQHSAQLAEYRAEIDEEVLKVTSRFETLMNEHFSVLVPRAQIKLDYEPPPLSPKADIAILSRVEIDGQEHGIERQGHGVQRAVMIAALQSLASSNAARVDVDDPGRTPSAPALLLAIEEPELYQHPVRARHFSKVLRELSDRNSVQVALCTHSPIFVEPDQFEQILRFRLREGASEVIMATVASIVDATGSTEAKVRKAVERELPGQIADGFFAEGVVAVEGDTDRVVLEAIADRSGSSFAANGIEVIAMGGKGNLRIPRAILEAFEIPVYCVFDGDAGHADRKHPAGGERHGEVEGSSRSATNNILGWLPDSEPVFGDTAREFGDSSCVTRRWTMFEDDLEEELAGWDDYISCLAECSGTELREKNVHAYRYAARTACHEQAPPVLKALVTAALDLESWL